MALQVWLPLTKDLRNQGLNGATATIGGTVSLTEVGKLGKCATIGTAAGGITLPASTMTSFTECSVAFWIKIISWNIGYATFFQAGLGSTPWNNYIFGILRNNANSNLCFTLTNSSSSSTNASYVTSNLSTGQWYHLAFTYKAGTVSSYIDGVLDKSYSTTYVPNFAGITHISIGRSTNNSNYQTNCSLNDFRIYNHCLSEMEVKKLSKGLVLHYPLNRGGLGPNNLLKNGFGELGSENWDNNTNISTSDIPSGQSDIKASFGNGHAIEHIKLYPTHTYKFSTWIKATTTSGNTYPSLFPYDVDGKFINNYNCPDGFNLNTMTTLKQQLKAGDTKIYVNDLSQWNANSGHYYNWAAIFSYTDSHGYTYPDGAYTQNMGRFGSSTTAKANLDKTNNVITLLSAYTGPTMPVGTKVCASTEGSTYFYPWGGFNLANIQDWTYKESTVYGNHNRLRYAKYVTFWTYSNNRMAGIKIRDLTNEEMDSTTEYDCSGFCNNGTRTGTFSWTSDTPKYAVSTSFNGSNTKIERESLTNEVKTACFWLKTNSTKNQIFFCDYNSGLAFGFWRTTNILVSSNSASKTTYAISSLSMNQWHHISLVKQSSSFIQLYIDGVPMTSSGDVDYWSPINMLNIGSRNGTYPFNGGLSDFRMYATALSASDVKSLYQNCATIDPDGTIRGQIRS